MTKKMIIDATHSEETRVALIADNNRLTDFDFESTNKPTIKSNVYLAKIARVEPSLQVAFIDYGGNRHGFLAFNEIHPDYFRIPISDREAIKAEMNKKSSDESEIFSKQESPSSADEPSLDDSDNNDLENSENHISKELSQENAVENFVMPIATMGGETSSNDDDELANPKRAFLHQKYKIQEVIHRNQIVLVQVIKEERGGKGAALTTFLSIAGRYGVLMPNSPRSGGISRKISSGTDRIRLKKILEELAIPEGMGLIIRTAGRERTKIEIRRDAEFLMRAWNDIRDLTLQSIAPALIYEEDDIIKRAIRDLYAKDVEEIFVEGEEGYKTARTFMKTLMPSHVKRIQHYKDEDLPLFHKYKVEAQIDEMYTPVVYLPSGGSIVIQPTEALVSIDINSGRSTRERHIEETAFKTNLEAADEIVRQIRLRDLAGLIVIDFIDMEDNRHTNAVERRIRDAFRDDRARIQMGKISPFGLLELSRQRLRPSILETSSRPCSHCNATGFVRSTESTALFILRIIEEEAMSGKVQEFQIFVFPSVAFYVLNTKRDHLQKIEARLKVKVFIEGDDSLINAQFRIIRLKHRQEENIGQTQEKDMAPSSSTSSQSVVIPINISDKDSAATVTPLEAESAEHRPRHRRHRRRPHRNHEAHAKGLEDQQNSQPSGESQEASTQENLEEATSLDQQNEIKRHPHSRRGRRYHPDNRPPRTDEAQPSEINMLTPPSPPVLTLIESPSQPFLPKEPFNSAQAPSDEGSETEKKKSKWWKRFLDA